VKSDELHVGSVRSAVAAGAIRKNGPVPSYSSGLHQYSLSAEPHLDPRTGRPKVYLLLAGPGLDDWADALLREQPERFHYRPSKWEKFPDGTDHILLGGFKPRNEVRGSHVLFLASFANNDVTLAQYHALVALCESFVESLTIVLPYFPTGTMERVETEGEVATANTMAKLFSSLPNVGKPIRLMLYDLHTLQNRFYFHGATLPTMHTAFPLLIEAMKKLGKDENKGVTCVCFPDEGAEKRFKFIFDNAFPNMASVTCSKKRVGDVRKVVVKDGAPEGQRIVIVDDLVQSGGTLYECGRRLLDDGATQVFAFVVHAIFPNKAWKKFVRGGERAIFERMWCTDSNPHVTDEMPTDDVFTVIPLMQQVLKDL
jgi:phosphoribosylpyrophosphate synthetase